MIRSVHALHALLFAALAACSAATTDNFQNPVPSPPDTCAPIASLPGCDNGSLSFACATSDRPDSGGDTNLVCSDGTPGGGSSTLYCCAPYAQPYSECVPDTTLAGCGATSMGFACSGATTPSDADPTIACSAAATGNDGVARYCCNTAAPPPTCAVDATGTGCTGVAIGYACVGTDAPSAGDASLACTVGTPAADGHTDYCCVPFARDPQICDEARDVGCAGSGYGFACNGGATPEEQASELTCTTSVGDQPGYCCHL